MPPTPVPNSTFKPVKEPSDTTKGVQHPLHAFGLLRHAWWSADHPASNSLINRQKYLTRAAGKHRYEVKNKNAMKGA
jgi:hypothetical protein